MYCKHFVNSHECPALNRAQSICVTEHFHSLINECYIANEYTLISCSHWNLGHDSGYSLLHYNNNDIH